MVFLESEDADSVPICSFEKKTGCGGGAMTRSLLLDLALIAIGMAAAVDRNVGIFGYC